MAKQTSSADSSLPLYEVLEAEFVALHGELPSDHPSSSEPETRLRGLWAAVHALKEKRTALCISGGGIRSATFGLGILQGLARCGLLEKFHYISTVSGGGYIGSWLSAWIKNDPNGIRGVVGELKRRPDSTLNPEPQPVRHLSVVSDGAEDLECAFADLGEAVRKTRIDFGIPIEFGTMTIYPRSAIDTLKTPGHNCAVGRIRYSVVDGADAPDGLIIYIKAACYGDEPRDIYEYFKTNPTFPHESTGDQFFSESQFESYRMLGAYTMEKLCTDCDGDFRCFIADILKRHLQIEPPVWLAELLEAHEGENKVA
jgi:hypothetical protein